jgi:hypothetical protein
MYSGHQVAPVGRGADEEIVRGGRDGAVQRDLQRDVSVLGAVEREIVAEEQEALLARRDQIDDVGQVDRGRSSPPR